MEPSKKTKGKTSDGWQSNKKKYSSNFKDLCYYVTQFLRAPLMYFKKCYYEISHYYYFFRLLFYVLQDCNVTSYFGCAAHLIKYILCVYMFHEQYDINVLTFIFFGGFFCARLSHHLKQLSTLRVRLSCSAISIT